MIILHSILYFELCSFLLCSCCLYFKVSTLALLWNWSGFLIAPMIILHSTLHFKFCSFLLCFYYDVDVVSWSIAWLILVQNDLKELNTLLHVANPTIFDKDPEQFESVFSVTTGLSDKEQDERRRELHLLLQASRLFYLPWLFVLLFFYGGVGCRGWCLIIW